MLERNLADFDSARKNLYEATLTAAQGIKPFSFNNREIRLADVAYDDKDDEDKFPERFDYTAQADALTARSTLGRRLRGTWQMYDTETGKLLEQRRSLLAVVPRVNEDGTMIYRGSRYAMLNQQRVKPSLFARVKKNAEVESHVNVAQGTGTSHRYILNPETGQFSVNVGHSRIPLVPFLRLLGTTDDQIREAWGAEIAEKNFAKNDRGALQKLYERLVSKRDQVPGADPQTQQLLIQKAVFQSQIDPWSTERTTGILADKLSPEVILAATKKVLALNKQDADGDDRDHIAYQTFHTVEDLLPERIKLDRGSLVRKTLREAIRKGSLGAISPKLLQQHIQSGIFESSLGVQPEFANPLDGMDRATRLTKMGEGGLSSLDSVPMESRDVHMSQMGFVDGARTTESLKTGIDVNLVSGAVRGADGRLRTPVVNKKTGQLEYKSPEDLVDATVAFSDQDHEVPGYLVVSKAGQFDYAKPEEVDYVLPNPEDSMMSHMSNLIPGKNASVQNRLAMGTRMLAQSLPLREAEAPWVQSAVPGANGEQSYEELYSNRVGTVKSLYGGTVKDVQPGFIIVTTPEGDKRVSLHNNTPLGSKTRLNNTAVVKPGDTVKPGQLLATSNFTNSQGVMAMGRNARVALMPWGDNYEDAFTISRSFADKLTSDHAYRYRLSPEEGWRLNKQHYIGSIPSEFKKEQLEKLDDQGVIQVGQKVRPGDPLILAAAPKKGSTSQRITRKRGPSFQDQSLTWDQDVDGVVQAVRVLPNGDRVVQVGADHPTQDGDKLADRYGAKGVVTVVPDEQMIQDKDGRPYDIVASDLGLISRSNAGRAADILLGKVAAHRGKPIKLEDFDTNRDLIDYARQELEKEGIPDMEEVYDPRNGRKIPKVLTGNTFIMKLHHMSASKSQARGVGRYSQEGTPAKGGDEGAMAKRLSNQEMNALMAHQAYEFVREGSLVRGQRNEEYWSRYMNGHDVPTPDIPLVYQKFHSYLKAIGVNPVKEGTKTKLMLLSDKDTLSMAGAREVRSGETVDANKDLKPIAGGLFDPKTFGDGCFHPSVEVWTEHGPIPIGQLVKEKRACRVWSYNFQTQQFELKAIRNWFTNHSAEGIGHARFDLAHRSTVAYGGHLPRTLWGTRGHQVYNLAGNKGNLAEANKLVAAAERLSYSQSQVLYGSILGDGHIDESGYWCEKHCKSQAEYLQFKVDVFGLLAPSGLKPTSDVTNGKRHKKVAVISKVHAEFKRARALCYVGNRKIVSQELLDQIDELGLAIWFMDDGSCRRAKDKKTVTVSLATNAFSEAEIKLIQNWLVSRWGLQSFTSRENSKYGDRDCGWVILISGRYASRFLDLVAPYIVPCMAYKIPVSPATRLCKLCGRSIAKTRAVCNRCVARRVQEVGTRDNRFYQMAIRQLGRIDAVRQMVVDTDIPSEPDPLEQHLQLVAKVGAAVEAVRVDNRLRHELEEVQVEYVWQSGRRWEKTRTVYDIEVEDNHNYFANGILVSNSQWARYQLSEPIPHPLMEDPIRKLMGVTKNDYRAILSGEKEFGRFGAGPDAIKNYLGSMDLNREVQLARAKAKDSRKTHREAAVVRLRYLRGLQDRSIDPKDLMLQQIPILPPTFRPVSKLSGKDAPLIDGMNLLYRDMIDADKALKGIKSFSSKPSAERLAVYDAVQAAMGLREPVDPELRQKKVTGLMGRLMGQHGPKTGYVQRKLLSGTVDLVGRGVIAPSTDLGLDEVGIPEGQAWETFKMPIIREMRRQGRPIQVAMKEWEQRSPTAKSTLERVMSQKLVAMSRAPVLHKFGMLAYHPKLIRGNTIRMNPLVYQGYAADNDGDQVNFHVILGDKAVEEAKRKWLPSRTLVSPRDFKTPMFVPNQDHALGLYRASVDRNDKARPVVYATLDDAKRAFARGEINIDTPVRILK